MVFGRMFDLIFILLYVLVWVLGLGLICVIEVKWVVSKKWYVNTMLFIIPLLWGGFGGLVAGVILHSNYNMPLFLYLHDFLIDVGVVGVLVVIGYYISKEWGRG